MQQIILYCVACLAISFLLGSIPWGVIISKMFYRTDIREHGSGNIGTTNAIRTMGVVGGVAVFSLDFVKGLLAGVLAMALGLLAAWNVSQASLATLVDGGEPIVMFGLQLSDSTVLSAFNTHIYGLIQGLGIFGSISGHVFSPWLHFKGGKGIAVAAGCLFFGYGWQGWLMLVAVFAVLVVITRYVSVGSITAAVCAPFVAYWSSGGELLFVVLVLLAASLVIWAHRSNISRLRAGTEYRIGQKKEVQE
ncbi:MAG: glycerol-3-phosphate 1-O-acyltransferase PlsY [Coriobacteriales bacterium]|nr:glycerol-3-phosphate 1-O-acyltransferase PlsY [Coriobacteriales bacterium]